MGSITIIQININTPVKETQGPNWITLEDFEIELKKRLKKFKKIVDMINKRWYN